METHHPPNNNNSSSIHPTIIVPPPSSILTSSVIQYNNPTTSGTNTSSSRVVANLKQSTPASSGLPPSRDPYPVATTSPPTNNYDLQLQVSKQRPLYSTAAPTAIWEPPVTNASNVGGASVNPPPTTRPSTSSRNTEKSIFGDCDCDDLGGGGLFAESFVCRANSNDDDDHEDDDDDCFTNFSAADDDDAATDFITVSSSHHPTNAPWTPATIAKPSNFRRTAGTANPTSITTPSTSSPPPEDDDLALERYICFQQEPVVTSSSTTSSFPAGSSNKQQVPPRSAPAAATAATNPWTSKTGSAPSTGVSAANVPSNGGGGGGASSRASNPPSPTIWHPDNGKPPPPISNPNSRTSTSPTSSSSPSNSAPATACHLQLPTHMWSQPSTPTNSPCNAGPIMINRINEFVTSQEPSTTTLPTANDPYNSAFFNALTRGVPENKLQPPRTSQPNFHIDTTTPTAGPFLDSDIQRPTVQRGSTPNFDNSAVAPPLYHHPLPPIAMLAPEGQQLHLRQVHPANFQNVPRPGGNHPLHIVGRGGPYPDQSSQKSISEGAQENASSANNLVVSGGSTTAAESPTIHTSEGTSDSTSIGDANSNCRMYVNGGGMEGGSRTAPPIMKEPQFHRSNMRSPPLNCVLAPHLVPTLAGPNGLHFAMMGPGGLIPGSPAGAPGWHQQGYVHSDSVKIPLGEKGRMELKSAIRQAVRCRPALRDKMNEIAKLKCATIPQLLRIAGICGLWPLAVEISERFMQSKFNKQSGIECTQTKQPSGSEFLRAANQQRQAIIEQQAAMESSNPQTSHGTRKRARTTSMSSESPEGRSSFRPSPRSPPITTTSGDQHQTTSYYESRGDQLPDRPQQSGSPNVWPQEHQTSSSSSPWAGGASPDTDTQQQQWNNSEDSCGSHHRVNSSSTPTSMNPVSSTGLMGMLNSPTGSNHSSSSTTTSASSSPSDNWGNSNFRVPNTSSRVNGKRRMQNLIGAYVDGAMLQQRCQDGRTGERFTMISRNNNNNNNTNKNNKRPENTNNSVSPTNIPTHQVKLENEQNNNVSAFATQPYDSNSVDQSSLKYYNANTKIETASSVSPTSTFINAGLPMGGRTSQIEKPQNPFNYPQQQQSEVSQPPLASPSNLGSVWAPEPRTLFFPSINNNNNNNNNNNPTTASPATTDMHPYLPPWESISVDSQSIIISTHQNAQLSLQKDAIPSFKPSYINDSLPGSGRVNNSGLVKQEECI